MRSNTRVILTLFCLTGMAVYAHAYTWQDVQQKAGPARPKPVAYLKVYSEAQVYNDGDIARVKREPYTIYSADGQKLRWIAFNNEDPKVVTLPPGQYVIVPETGMSKREVYGAVLKQDQLTEVHMQGENPTYAPVNF